MKRLLALLLLTSVPALAADLPRVGDFFVSVKTDPVTDEDASFIYTNGQENGEETLYFLCRRGEFGMIYEPEDDLGESETFDGLYRFDKRAPSAEFPWESSTTGKAVFLPEILMKTFVTGALTAKQVVLRVYDDEGMPNTSTFSLAGLRQALNKLPCAKGY